MLGVSAFMKVPESIDEFNTFLAGSTSTALDYANAEAYYRGIAPKVRSKFLALVAEKTGIAPRVTGSRKVGDKEIETTEKDTLYIKHVIASGTSAADLAPLLQTAFDAVGWDLSSTRSSGPNAKDREVAEFILNAINTGESSYERVKTNYEKMNSGLELALESDGSLAVETLAEAARVDRLRRESERMVGVL